VDGPEFDAHRVDFAVLVQRNSMYRAAEQKSMEEFQREKPQLDTVPAEEKTTCALQGHGR
jgi:hypothetical protein